ncbi:MAG: hypothetical protein JZU63_00630, partial [Rhodoferax sp.]|nr:hypothetical protein [Rhodoferax sp.]
DTNSVAVANYYQQVRGIPERNMVPYTFFPNGSTSFNSNNLWSLTLHLRTIIQERGLTGRFNGIAVAGTVPLLASSGNLAFQAGLYYSPAFTGAGAYKSYVSDNLAYSVPTNPVTCEIRDDRPFVSGSTTNIYWPVSFVGFTGLNGNAPDEVFALIDRSKAADGARPDGVIYWPTNGDIRSYCRESQITDVAPIWTARGIRYEVLNGNWVSGKSDIVGQIVGSASADQGINGNTYLPGA